MHLSLSLLLSVAIFFPEDLTSNGLRPWNWNDILADQLQNVGLESYFGFIKCSNGLVSAILGCQIVN